MVRRDARSQNPAGPWQRRSGETQGNGCGEGSPKLRWTLNDETRNSESPPNYGANQPDATRCAREGLGRPLKVQWQERPTLAERRGEKALTSTHRWASANARAQSASASSIPSRIRGRERWWVRRQAAVPRTTGQMPRPLSGCKTPGHAVSPFVAKLLKLRQSFEPQELEDVAFSKLPKTPRGPDRAREAGRATGGGGRHQTRGLFRLQKSQRGHRPPGMPRPGPPRGRPVAASVPPPLPHPHGAPGLPAAAAFVVGQSGLGDATVLPEAVARATLPLPRRPPDRGPPSSPRRGGAPAPASCPHPSRLRPPGRLPSPGDPGSGAPTARGRPARLTYQE